MRKLSLTEWASLGEVIGTAAVVISLLFVTYSIKQNTNALQGQTENILFERHAELANQLVSDPSMAAILVKMRGVNPQLSAIESVRWEKYQLNMVDIWALAYTRHRDQLLSDPQWQAWDGYFTETFSTGGEKITRQQWNALVNGFDRGFWEHVDAELFRQNPSSD